MLENINEVKIKFRKNTAFTLGILLYLLHRDAAGKHRDVWAP